MSDTNTFKMTSGYRAFFEQSCMQIIYNIMRTKTFIPVGLDLSATALYFEDNNTFKLKEMTFAYYNPIENAIHINIEDKYFTDCSGSNANIERAGRLFFVLFHEIMHKILMHSERRNDKKTDLWNIACDYEVHNMYHLYSVTNGNDEANKSIMESYLKIADQVLFNPKKDDFEFLFDKNYIEKVAEEIYVMIENSKEESSETMKITLDNLMGDANGNNSGSNNDDENGANGEDEEGTDGNGENDENGKGSEKDSKSKKSSKSSKSGKNDNDDENEPEIKKYDGQHQNNTGNDNVKSNAASNIEVSVTKTTYRLPNGKKYTSTVINWPEENQLPPELKKSEEEKERAAQNKACNKSLLENTFEQMAKGKGDLPAECKKFLKKLFHIKMDWTKILRNSLQTILEKSDYFAWNKVRTSSFLLPGMSYLPDIVEDDEKYGTLIIARDESGSMTDEDIAKAGKIIMDAKEFYKKIVLLKHDTTISKVLEFEEINNDVIQSLLTREKSGGTSHKEVFKYLENYQYEHSGERVSCFISITDMESDIQQHQHIIPSNIPVIYLAPVNSEYNWKDVIGKIIPIEL